MVRNFQTYVGIDYSGRGEPTAGTPAIQVYMRCGEAEAVPVRPVGSRNWSRAALAAYLRALLAREGRIIVGIDQAFSFPLSYMRRYGIKSWDHFLADFRKHWPTDQRSVESLRHDNPRHGEPTELRLTDRWTVTGKSVFLFDVNGSVAMSTHAGLPWLLRIREHCGDRVFIWPFDGWTPPAGKHVIAEVYPSLFRNRYRESGLKGDALDAFAVTQWLGEMDGKGFLTRYFDPPLTTEEKTTARLEGWILGLY